MKFIDSDDSDEDPDYCPVEESSSDTDYEIESLTKEEMRNLNQKENVDPIGMQTAKVLNHLIAKFLS